VSLEIFDFRRNAPNFLRTERVPLRRTSWRCRPLAEPDRAIRRGIKTGRLCGESAAGAETPGFGGRGRSFRVPVSKISHRFNGQQIKWVFHVRSAEPNRKRIVSLFVHFGLVNHQFFPHCLSVSLFLSRRDFLALLRDMGTHQSTLSFSRRSKYPDNESSVVAAFFDNLQNTHPGNQLLWVCGRRLRKTFTIVALGQSRPKSIEGRGGKGHAPTPSDDTHSSCATA
jgi:hypothetical protein